MRGEQHDLPYDREPSGRGWRDQGWRSHLIVFAAATGGAIALWQLTRDPNPAPQDYGVNYWWPFWLGLVWAVLVLVHYLYADGRLSLPGRPRPVPERQQPRRSAALDSLTAREREILALLAEGYANKELARRLHISERTARTHVSNILRKLEVPSRTHAALLAVQLGFAAPSQTD